MKTLLIINYFLLLLIDNKYTYYKFDDYSNKLTNNTKTLTKREPNEIISSQSLDSTQEHIRDGATILKQFKKVKKSRN